MKFYKFKPEDIEQININNIQKNEASVYYIMVVLTTIATVIKLLFRVDFFSFFPYILGVLLSLLMVGINYKRNHLYFKKESDNETTIKIKTLIKSKAYNYCLLWECKINCVNGLIS